MKLLMTSMLLISATTFAMPSSECSGFINRPIVEDIQVSVDFSKCDFSNSDSCITELDYDDANECRGIGEDTQCTEAQGLGALEVELIKNGKKIKVAKIISSRDFQLSDILHTTKKMKKKLSFLVKKSSVYMRYGLLRTKMKCQ